MPNIFNAFLSRAFIFIYIALILALFGCAAADAPVAFLKHRVIDPHPNTGKECCTDILMLGDIDGDGFIDVVIGAEGASDAGLVWYQYPTWEKHAIAKGNFTTDGQTTDMDGDGDLDVVVGTFENQVGLIVWYENVSGTGTGAWAAHPVGKGYAHDVITGDVNGDGRLDIVTCDKKKVVLWEQKAPNLFIEHVILEKAGEGIAIADIDGDGDLDIVCGSSWLENPGASGKGGWKVHPIAPGWHSDTRVFVADMNGDGRPDVILSVSEGKGRISWFESPRNPGADPWPEHPVEKEMLEGVHSLQVADIDGDGKLDIIAAEMHTSREKRVMVYVNQGESFKRLVLSRNGSHNMRVGDIDRDGDIDIVGKNYAGAGRVIEMWENLTSETKKWEYVSIDARRPKDQKGMMGLCFADVDRDGRVDVIAGSFLYRNPGGDLRGEWKRTLVADQMDVYFALDVDGDELSDLVGIKGGQVYWIEASDRQGTSWVSRSIGNVDKGRTQGYAVARLVPGRKPQLVFTRGKNLYVLEIPEDPEGASWPLHRISTANEEEGIAVGDIDGDGDPDIAAVHADGHHVIWLENPGKLESKWQVHVVGGQVDDTKSWIDRIALADINGDGRLDIIATEERQDWKQAAHLYWFEAPADPKKGNWKRSVIAKHRSLNSISVVVVDRDGSPDIVVAEHTDQKDQGTQDNLTVIYLNRNKGKNWLPHVVERGLHSSHLGAKSLDLNRDGFPEIVSIGWAQHQNVHLWKKVVPGSGWDDGKKKKRKGY